MTEPEHISSILVRAIKALAEEWKSQGEERESQEENGLKCDSQKF